MNWDEQLIEACTETDGTPHPHTDHVLTGAKWQRDQLRTDEAVERVARGLNEYGWTCGGGAHEPGEYDTCKDCRYWCMDAARAAITALLGEDS